jgi:hypothetical protein
VHLGYRNPHNHGAEWMYTNDTPEIRRAWWSELGMNRIVVPC